MRALSCAALAAALACRRCASASDAAWAHGWLNLESMMWANFRSPKMLTDDEAKWLAQHYSILSLEKCTGFSDGFMTEDAIYATAAQLKRYNKHLKVLMYWGTDGQLVDTCYAAGKDLKANHSDLYLRGADGQLVPAGKTWHMLDFRKEEARKWWTSIPLSSPRAPADVAGLIDGILADGVGYGGFVSKAGLGDTAQAEWLAGQYKALDELQATFRAANGGLVAGNGIAMTPLEPDHRVKALEHTGAVMDEHVAAYASRDWLTGKLNKTNVAENMAIIAELAAKGKVVLLNFSPGPVVLPLKWRGKATPKTNKARAEALLRYWDFTMAAFLTMVEPNVFFEYAWFYEIHEGVMPCLDQKQKAMCFGPPNWYNGRHIYQKLGAPLGPAARDAGGAFRWTRSFEHADVVLDLDKPAKSSVTWHATVVLDDRDTPAQRVAKSYADEARGEGPVAWPAERTLLA